MRVRAQVGAARKPRAQVSSATSASSRARRADRARHPHHNLDGGCLPRRRDREVQGRGGSAGHTREPGRHGTRRPAPDPRVERPHPRRGDGRAARHIAQRCGTREEQLGLDQSADSLQTQVSAAPVAQSNIVAITAQADSPDLARDIANGFAEGVVAHRSAVDPRRRREAITGLRRSSRRPRTLGSPRFSSRRTSRSCRAEPVGRSDDARGDACRRARRRRSRRSPDLTIIAGIFAGLVLGVGGAFAMHALDPRLRREEQLRALYRLPILARVPEEKPRARRSRSASGASGSGRASASDARSPRASSRRRRRGLPDAARDARRRAPRDGNSRSVLVTGPSPSEGKTTTALNLASSLALAGKRVILIEADLRRPKIGEALGVRAPRGIGERADRQRVARARRCCRRRPTATTCSCCSSTAPASGWRSCSRCRPRRTWSTRRRRWPTT